MRWSLGGGIRGEFEVVEGMHVIQLGGGGLDPKHADGKKERRGEMCQ